MRKDNVPKPGSKAVKQKMGKVREGKIAAKHERLLAEVKKGENKS
jgi:hypothetical protein